MEVNFIIRDIEARSSKLAPELPYQTSISSAADQRQRTSPVRSLCDIVALHRHTKEPIYTTAHYNLLTATMGFFGLFSSPEDKRKEEVRTGARAPDRSERRRCWDARDNFYQCLDKHDVIDSLSGEGKKTADKHCAKEEAAFQDNCASAWVTYFKKYRVADYQKKKTLERLEKEGANKMDIQGPGDIPGGPGGRR
ncbi:cytochrome oxidase c subunit VIb-domain-containing protein [Xylaria cf. heliscus]|nr:cytochrome oxidase c subunit VIb-domain-containing protein [Xylaria cf. heliscus]